MGAGVEHLSLEQKIRRIFTQRDEEKGKRILLEVITQAARQRHFSAAQRLRGLLIELAPMALNEIIRAAEIIDSEKTAAIDKKFLDIWKPLAGNLEWEEFLTLYYSLEHRKYQKDQMIVRQGEKDRSLYFINSGRIELFFQKNSKNILIKTVEPGQIIGGGSFFDASVWTVDAKSLGANISVLPWKRIREWQSEFPGLESKLCDFCNKFKIKPETIRKTGSDRREHERIRVSGRIAMVVLDRDGKPTNISTTGELFDISVGGVSFFLRIAQRDTARLLLKRKVGLRVFKSTLSGFDITGDIVAVRSQPVVGNEYAVSLKFNRMLTSKELTGLLSKIQIS